MSRSPGSNHVLGGGGFHHVALKTGAWDASVTFYTTTLGFTHRLGWTMANGRRAAMFDVGDGAYLEIFEDPDYQPADNGALLHLAIRTNDVGATLERVRALGLKVTMEPKAVTIGDATTGGPVPVRIAFFIGPNREVWELFQNELT
jgi:catechol 2,3-dioxygenase-like lactoylglutathione lyase family enzyme